MRTTSGLADARRAVERVVDDHAHARVVGSRFFALAGLMLGVLSVAMICWATYVWFSVGVPMHDVLIYDLAGIRVNTGGAVYDLRPIDPLPTGDAREFPIFGPPGIVVPWRLLAMVPWGASVWIVLMTACVLFAFFYMHIGTRGWAGAAVIFGLALPITVLIGVANIDAAILCFLIAAWNFRDRPAILGLLLGIAIPLKLTPIAMVVWLVASRRWRALAWTAGVGAVAATVTAVLTDPLIWFRYLEVARTAAVAGHAESIAWAGLLAVLVFFLRDDRFRFAISVALIPLGTPQGGVHSWAMLLACFTPFVRPVSRPAWLSRLDRASTSSGKS